MDNGYIPLIHDFAAKRLNTGYKLGDLLDYLRENGVDVDDDMTERRIRFVVGEVDSGQPQLVTGGPGTVYYMNPEAYYRHLDYLEMQSAQRNAKDARIWSILAIVVSALLALIQVVLTIMQLRMQSN